MDYDYDLDINNWGKIAGDVYEEFRPVENEVFHKLHLEFLIQKYGDNIAYERYQFTYSY